MAVRFHEFDWGTTPLGPVECWPESWRNAVQIILDSSFPTALALGSELIYFYNDAFIPLAGSSRHPSALGLPVPLAWKEIWEQILAPRFEHTLRTGAPTGEADLLMPLERSGYLEETFITFSFAALRDAQNLPNGIFCTAIETTARVIADRQLTCLRALAAQASLADTPEGACSAAAAILAASPRDLPFALLYLLDQTGRCARLAARVGLKAQPGSLAEVADLQTDCAWHLSEVALTRAAVVIDDIPSLVGAPIQELVVVPDRALALPIAGQGGGQLAGILIAGVNPMRPLAESREFHAMVAGHIQRAIANASAKQHALERARALAEIDRAKTVFFSNISHELRTPLTLLLAPLDEALGRDQLNHADRHLLEVARRGGGRLLKLVNSLLEFSRIEAGRVEASFEPTDLATFTTDLGSMFRSAFERGGVELRIDCAPVPGPVFVDRDMWEKIVLNLVSNALKFTLAGKVSIIQYATTEHIVLEVEDSGCGISPDDLPRLFERFFRGRGSQARTHEGSGIGLSLVHELVKIHGGTVEARSTLGQGTTMAVRIPRGFAHLDPERINAKRTRIRSHTGAQPYVEEALGWLPNEANAGYEEASNEEFSTEARAVRDTDEPATTILVVDDNTDMREYLCRLLGQRWHVESAADGVDALARIVQRPVDLVIADVMMPKMDGFALLRALRENQATTEIPVMLVSARAGEEASAEGLRAGADDYVIKPFSARELLARVESRLSQARLRAAERSAREAAEKANQARDEFFAMLSHELRTPLMAMLGWTALLRGNRLVPEERAHAIDIIERNARTQRSMIHDLLDVSRIVTGRLRIDARLITSLEPLITIVVDSFRPVAIGKGLRITTCLEASAAAVHADPERLQQVVWNLLSNAIQFTPSGGLIEVLCSHRDREVELTVRDSGRGISAEAIPHVFKRYWQAGVEQRRQGLGLGLAIARRIVELHGGRIDVASEGEGRGASFTVRLPMAARVADHDKSRSAFADEFAPALSAGDRILDAVTAVAERSSEAATEGPDALELLGMSADLSSSADLADEPALRVLLIEDHDGIAKACQRLLISHGHAVVRAKGMAAALSAIQRRSFDLLLCDLSLPDGSGLELLARLRAGLGEEEAVQDIPAIAMSGSVYQDDIDRCLAAGFKAHLAKPFDEEGLMAMIRRVTAGTTGERNAERHRAQR